MDEACKICGHPGPFAPPSLPDPDPRKGIAVRCEVCERDITYDTHQWRSDHDGRWVCCGCMASTKSLRDLSAGKFDVPPLKKSAGQVMNEFGTPHVCQNPEGCRQCLRADRDKQKGDVGLLREVALSRLERVIKWTKRANEAELQLVGIRAWARLECDKASADLTGTNPELPLASLLGGRLRLAQEFAQKMDAGDFKGLPDCVSCQQGGELCGYHRAPVSEGADSGISEKTSLPPDRLRECHCSGLKENKECPVHGWL